MEILLVRGLFSANFLFNGFGMRIAWYLIQKTILISSWANQWIETFSISKQACKFQIIFLLKNYKLFSIWLSDNTYIMFSKQILVVLKKIEGKIIWENIHVMKVSFLINEKMWLWLWSINCFWLLKNTFPKIHSQRKSKFIYLSFSSAKFLKQKKNQRINFFQLWQITLSNCVFWQVGNAKSNF